MAPRGRHRPERSERKFGAHVSRGTQPAGRTVPVPVPLPSLDRKALLLTTALASTLFVGAVVAPAPAMAVTDCLVGNPAPGPITVINPGDSITCTPTEYRANAAGNVIELQTYGDNRDIYVKSTSELAGYEHGIRTQTGGTNTGAGSPITILNTGDVDVDNAAGGDRVYGIYARVRGDENPIVIDNTGDLGVVGNSAGYGILGSAGNNAYGGANSPVTIDNRGDVVVTAGNRATGIRAEAILGQSDASVRNWGDLAITANANQATGISAQGGGSAASDANMVSIDNWGDVIVNADTNISFGTRMTVAAPNGGGTTNNRGLVRSTGFAAAYGLDVNIAQRYTTATITNSGDVVVKSENGRAVGLNGQVNYRDAELNIVNTGNVSANGVTGAVGFFARAAQSDVDINFVNKGHVAANTDGAAYGLYATSFIRNVSFDITNSGVIDAESETDRAVGIAVRVISGDETDVTIKSSGRINAKAPGTAAGVLAFTLSEDSPLHITNSGDITAISSSNLAAGLVGQTQGTNSPLTIKNSGNIDANGDSALGIRSHVLGAASPLHIENSGDIRAQATDSAGGTAAALYGASLGMGNTITIHNSGSAYAKGGNITAGILARNLDAAGKIEIHNSGSVYAKGGVSNAAIGIYFDNRAPTTIYNTGDVSASSHRAIYVAGLGAATIYNAGLIAGFVQLTEQNDRFINQAGGRFETKKTSFFGGGNDLFVNQSGGTVQAATDGTKTEKSAFEGLETFKNRGLISMIDGTAGDSFTISNTPGGTDLKFQGGGWLGVDVFLDGAGSPTDTFTVEGNVSGTTTVVVNNTNGGAGTFNSQGIPIVFVDGATPSANNFQLAEPIDTGFFDYDLFFVPTGSGFWELRSSPGAGAHLLPQLVTAAQDIWHQGSSTWFDRTADLRVQLNGGMAPALDQGGKSLGGAPQGDGIAPAVWVRGSGGWLDRDDSASTSAFGRNYSFDLDRNLETIDFQMGLDLGTRDFLSQGDVLVFGVLGGFVHGDLDYNSINRNFDFDGGQVGAYATYLKGGLFVDTLLNVHLYELETATLGFPNNDLDATTVGLRTDTGYRFGSFSGGAFLEPLATLEVTWADIDGFAFGGNTVSFDDDANVRGRLGLRAGTTMQAWEGTMMEPFVTGSLWSNLSGDNQATLVSAGRSFRFEDDLDDVWGEVSAGVNFFNFSETTSVFAKVDVTFGDDVSGVGGKAGMRVAW